MEIKMLRPHRFKLNSILETPLLPRREIISAHKLKAYSEKKNMPLCGSYLDFKISNFQIHH